MKYKITITPEHAKVAKGYFNNCSCLLATALKEKFPNNTIWVSGSSFFIDDKCITFPFEIGERITGFYNRNYDSQPVLDKNFSFTVDIPKGIIKKKTK